MSDPTPNTPAVIEDALPRDTKGRFQRGHLVNQSHGAETYLRRGWVDSPEVAERERAFGSQMLADLGGAENLTAIERALARHLVKINTLIELLGAYLGANGPLTPRGRQRSCVSTFIALCASYDRMAKTLGLQRRAKDVVPSLEEIMNASDEEHP